VVALTVLVLVVGAGAIGAAVLVVRGGSGAEADTSHVWKVTRRTYAFTITESGTIQAERMTRIRSRVKERVSIISLVAEGTQITEEDVKAGKVLVQLDAAAMSDKLTRQQISLKRAEASLTRAREDLDIKRKENASKVRAAARNVRFAGMDLAEYLGETLAAEAEAIEDFSSLGESELLDGAAQKRKTQLKSNVELGTSKLDRAEDRLRGTRTLYEKQYVSENDLKADELDVEVKKADIEQAELALKLFLRYELPKEAEMRVADVGETELALERVESRARSEEAQAVAELGSAETTHKLETSAFKELQQQLEYCTIRAEQPGLIVYATSADWRGRNTNPIEEGITLRERQEIIHLPDLSSVIAKIAVPEAVVERVRAGQTAVVTVDALPDVPFRARVTEVAPMPDPQGWMSNVNVFSTIVTLEGTHPALRPGMSCSAKIQIATAKGGICVPVQTVTTRGRKRVCYVVTPAGHEVREVTTGEYDDMFVEVLTGLKAGEMILLRPPLSAAGPEEEEAPTDEAQPEGRPVASPGPAAPAAGGGAPGMSRPTRGGGEGGGAPGMARPARGGGEGGGAPGMSRPARGGGGAAAGGGQFDWAGTMKKITDAGFTREQMGKWRTEGISEQDKETLRKAGVSAQFLEMMGRGGRGGGEGSGRRQGGEGERRETSGWSGRGQGGEGSGSSGRRQGGSDDQ
jgi:HlyD family secretion protein